MHEHKPAKTRITLERVTVTTIRRRDKAVLYCEICKREIDDAGNLQLSAGGVIDVEAEPTGPDRVENLEKGEIEK